MTRETTFGLLLVVVLTGVFGFMVYKRMHKPADLAAGTAEADAAAAAEGGTDPEASGAQALLTVPASETEAGTSPGLDSGASTAQPAQFDAATVTLAAAEAKPMPIEKPAVKKPTPSWPPTNDDLFLAPPAKSNSVKNETPAQPATSDDPFASETAASAPVTKAPVTATTTVQAMEDPFSESAPASTPLSKPEAFDPLSAPEPTITIRARTTPALSATPVSEPEADPFANELTPSAPTTTTTARSTPDPLPQETLEPLNAITTAAPIEPTRVELAPVESAPEVDPLSQPVPQTNAFEFPPANSRTAARVIENEASAASTTVIERAPAMPVDLDFPNPPSRAATPSRTANSLTASDPLEFATTAPVTSGSTYVLQPQDDYWKISKSVYGAGRYAEALARHNAATIPDPKRMKPGTPIATPSAEELEARYPELIPDLKAATATTTIVASGDSYVTAPGDNFWRIARKVYGDGRYFQALAEHNRATIADPLKLQPGMTVHTPPLDVLQSRTVATGAAATAMNVVPTRTATMAEASVAGFFVSADDQPQYRVASGDTLSSIARAHLGRSSRSVQILEMNRDVLKDGNTLNVGTVLRLPADASQVQTAP